MLTPDMISNRKFDKSGFGNAYKAEEVDAFLSEISMEYSRVCEEKSDAEEKLEVLADKLEEYRSNEDSLRTVLIGAQKLGDSIIRDAKGKAEVILSDADQKAKQAMYEAEKQIKAEHDELDRIRRETTEFKKRLLAMYKQHLELITAMPEVEPAAPSQEPAVEQQAPVQQAQAEPAAQEQQPADEFDEVTMAETKEISFPVQE